MRFPSEITQAAVVGCGVMGAGIAQVLATAGVDVTCIDRSEHQVDAARRAIVAGRYGLERGVDRGKLTAEAADAARQRLRFTTDLTAAVADVQLVVEAVPEDLEAKLAVFSTLGAAAGAETILATNTSGLPVIALASAARRPERVLAWHWASPAQVRPFAEIVRTPRTEPWVVELVTDLASRCGKHPHVLQENPRTWGFVANRVLFAALREAERVVEEGLADEATVDALMRDAYAWPFGPFELLRGASQGWGDERAGSLDAALGPVSSRAPAR